MLVLTLMVDALYEGSGRTGNKLWQISLGVTSAIFLVDLILNFATTDVKVILTSRAYLFLEFLLQVAVGICLIYFITGYGVLQK